MLPQTATVTTATAHTNTLAARIGFWNAKFAPGIAENMWPLPDPCAPTSECEPSAFFDYMTAEAPFVFLDGEMYSHDASGNVTGMNATLRMRTHHFTTFSIVHSNSRYGPPGSVVDAWERTPLPLSDAVAHNLPISNGYFDSGRTPSAFEYMRDHMGYRLELQRLTTSVSSASAASQSGRRRARGIGTRQGVNEGARMLALSLEVINRGFDVLHRRCKVAKSIAFSGAHTPLTHRTIWLAFSMLP